MRAVLILASGLLYYMLPGQATCRGILRDSGTNQVIEFANIGIIGKGLGTVSDEKGEYALSIPDSLLNDFIRISIIGYKPKTLLARDFQKQSEMRLEQQATVLKEVAVSVKKTKVKLAGNATRSKAVSAGFMKNSLGAEIGIRLPVKHPGTHIRKVMININANSLDTFPVFRFNVYSKDQNGYPGENLLSHNIIITPVEKTGYVEFDLKPYSIFVDEDVFITIEWIKDLGDAKGLYFSTKLVGNATYYRQSSQDKWRKISSIGVGLHAELAY